MVNSNSGVEGGSGYSFQRCCVVFLLFEDYEKLNIEDYFICLEHHEDFLFAFLDENRLLKKIDTYQAKKSRDDWKTDSDLCEIIGKMTMVGKELVNDPHDKSNNYQHTLNFLTNRNILLTSKQEKGTKQDIVKIQVSNRRK
ncbi:dsDNA nuclease domain-containing protein, partial [Vibrio cholerae]